MELKSYQQRVLDDLNSYLEHYQNEGNAASAYNNYWKYHERTPLVPDKDSYVKPYVNISKDFDAPHVCIKVPTGGGKTFIASASLKTIFNYCDDERRVVVWLVPSITILEQTIKNLSNPSHPYRQRVNVDFQNRVVVLDKAKALQGVDFSQDSIRENLTILIMSYDSLRARNKEERKVNQVNGQLLSFGEDASLMDVLRSVKPVVIVDESHNAESELSLEMLKNLNPKFILDLTATPREKSNIISFTSASELKKESMVKLPVIVYNHNKQTEVIESALNLQKQLEADAMDAENKAGVDGKYIRPIVLFQAEAKTGHYTFEKVKQTLLDLHIPEEQIKIKTAEVNEIDGIDLLSRDCPVRYIITINALREGWDCPFAYVLASLADKSSAVDVEQILGRVLRMPWTRRSPKNPMLNMSYVLTASNKFRDTLDNIVKGLNNAGFSENDCRKVDNTQPQVTTITDESDLFATPKVVEVPSSNANDEELKATEIHFNPNAAVAPIGDPLGKEASASENPKVNTSNNENKAVVDIQKQVEEQLKQEIEIQKQINEQGGTALPSEIQNQVKKYKIKDIFSEQAASIKIPQFLQIKEQELNNGNLPNLGFANDDFKQKDVLFSADFLLKDFPLEQQDAVINFDDVDTAMYQLDTDSENGDAVSVKKVDSKTIQHQKIMEMIQSSTMVEQKVAFCINEIKRMMGSMWPITDRKIEAYLRNVLANFTDEQYNNLAAHTKSYSDKIKKKIEGLADKHKRKKFDELLDIDKLEIKEWYSFPKEITPSSVCKAGLTKTLYEKEGKMNDFEWDVIGKVANLENVAFWTRNIDRIGFCINGFINHYPDFIIVTKNGKVVLLETKGDDRGNEDSENKIYLGQKWEQKAGSKYKYYMVFENLEFEGALKVDDFISRLSQL